MRPDRLEAVGELVGGEGELIEVDPQALDRLAICGSAAGAQTQNGFGRLRLERAATDRSSAQPERGREELSPCRNAHRRAV